jgi:site-specific DNA recombinase
MRKAVLYARVSSDLQQKERSIESQIEELKRQIEKTGDQLVKEYVDDGYSGALLDRPAMDELRRDLKRNVFDTIYILNADRIARDVTYQNIIVGEMLQYKKQIIINGKDYIQNPENKFTLTVLGAVSELERAKLIERVTRGRQHRLRQGILLGNGHRLYGYTYFKKTPTSRPSYAINEQEARIVRHVFETYAKGSIGTRDLARQLETMGVQKVKGRNQLDQSQIKGMLANETYTGMRYFNTMKEPRVPQNALGKTIKGRREYTDRSEWVGIPIPAIISKDLFDQVQKRVRHNEECWRNSRKPHLLSNIVWCERCNTRCYAYRRQYRARRANGLCIYDRVVYVCKTKKLTEHIPEINGQVLESCIRDLITDTLLVPAKLIECIDALKKTSRANAVRIEQRIKDATSALQSLELKRKRILDLYASGDLDQDAYVQRIREYQKETSALRAKQSDMMRNMPLAEHRESIEHAVARYCAAATKEYKHLSDFDSARAFLQQYTPKITYIRKNKVRTKIKIHGQVPFSIDGQELPLSFTIQHSISWADSQRRLTDTRSEKTSTFPLGI